ncbi:MAG: hypothetical protein HRU24_05480 [Gammaproteobacteria bacterium]|nr:hypothetical protein [Gammaproteobacteria bacterium]
MRKSSDLFHLVISGLTIVGWGTLFWSLLIFHQARPEMSTILTRMYQIEVRQHWLSIVYDKLIVMLVCCAVISFVSLFLNWYRRKTIDHKPWLSHILLLMVSGVAILVLTIWKPLMI